MCQIAVSGSDLHLTWIDGRDGNNEVYYKSSLNNGDTWGLDTRLTNNSVVDHQPYIAANQNAVYLSWYSAQVPAPGQMGIHYIYSTDNGLSWSSDIPLVTLPSASPAYPAKRGCQYEDERIYKKREDYLFFMNFKLSIVITPSCVSGFIPSRIRIDLTA
jgi:hypothetical protein